MELKLKLAPVGATSTFKNGDFFQSPVFEIKGSYYILPILERRDITEHIKYEVDTDLLQEFDHKEYDLEMCLFDTF